MTSGDSPELARLAEADRRIRSGDGLGAVTIMRELLPHMPKSPQAWLLFGQGCALVGDRATAEAAFRNCLRLAPQEATALNGLGSLALDHDEIELAERYLRQAVHLQPQLPEPRKNLALALARQERDAEAASLFRELQQTAPHFHQGLMDYGLFLLSRGEFGPGWDLYEER